jgi:hypothetical protein
MHGRQPNHHTPCSYKRAFFCTACECIFAFFWYFNTVVKVYIHVSQRRSAAAHVTFANRVTACGLSCRTRVPILADLPQARASAKAPTSDARYCIVPTSRCGFFDCVGLLLEKRTEVAQTRGVERCGGNGGKGGQHLIMAVFYISVFCYWSQHCTCTLRYLHFLLTIMQMGVAGAAGGLWSTGQGRFRTWAGGGMRTSEDFWKGRSDTPRVARPSTVVNASALLPQTVGSD